MKARRKPCRNCLYTKNHLGTAEDAATVRYYIGASGDSFYCHEHSEKVFCNGFRNCTL